MTNPTTGRRAHPEAALVEVLDCDREAYAAVYQDKAPKYADQARAGDFDTTPLVQAFARHRPAATQSLSTDLDKAQQRVAELEAENVRLREGLRSAANDMLVFANDPDTRETIAQWFTRRAVKARAVLNQTKESGN